MPRGTRGCAASAGISIFSMETIMNRRNTLKTFTAALLFLGFAFAAGNTVAQQPSAMDAVKAANQSFYTALSARDIDAMQKVWSNEPNVINMGPRHKAA